MNRPRTILVTAGPTVEDIDPVRYISNRASGRLGFEVARAALQRGHRVVMVHGPVAVDILRITDRVRRGTLERTQVRSADQMCRAVRKALPRVDAVVMNAAVADYTPSRPSKTKLKKSGAGLRLRLRPTVDILSELGRVKRRRKRPLVLVGFALETGRGDTEAARSRARLREARRKLSAKNLDAIVLDTPAEIGKKSGAFDVLLAEHEAPISFRGAKRAFATQLTGLVLRLCLETE